MMKYKYSWSDWMDGLGLCEKDEVQISLSDWMAGLDLCHNDEIQISISELNGWFRSLQ